MVGAQRLSTLLLAVVLAVVAAILGFRAQASAETSTDGNRASLADSAPVWANSSNEVTKAPGSRHVDARVYLKPRNSAELDALANAVSDPSSPQYGQFITPEQYRSRFGPTDADVNAVKDWLTGAGLRVTGVGAGKRYVVLSGDVDAAQRAFGVTLELYRHGGTQALAPAGDLSLPQGLSDKVLGVVGLESPGHTVEPATAGISRNSSADPPPEGFRNARPCSLSYGQITARYQANFKTPLPKFQGSYRPYAVCGYVPRQFRGAYGIKGSGLDGKGVTVAVTDAYASPTILKDANTYATRHGDPAFAGGQFEQTKLGSFKGQKVCDPSDWYGEETLDIEAVHGMARASKVHYYASRSCSDGDFLDTIARVVDDNEASIVTNSWGGFSSHASSGSIRACQSVFKQGAVQGIGFFFSSGDSGDEVASSFFGKFFGKSQTNYPASDPYVTAVGGTSLAVGRRDDYLWEAGWGTNKFELSESGDSWQPLGFLYGAGGGFSTLFNRPAYQQGVVAAGSPAGRAVPDVGLDADPTTGMLVGETQTFPAGVYYDEYRSGGTSLASPLMAGVQALRTQVKGHRLGFANPLIYDLARSGGEGFTDITSAHDSAANVRSDYANDVNPKDGILYSVRTFDDDSSLHTNSGWDDVTGVGSPNAAYFEAAER
jgi:subtilase family serine protease